MEHRQPQCAKNSNSALNSGSRIDTSATALEAGDGEQAFLILALWPCKALQSLHQSSYGKGHWFLDSFMSSPPVRVTKGTLGFAPLEESSGSSLAHSSSAHGTPRADGAVESLLSHQIPQRGGVYVTSPWISACWWQLQCSGNDFLWCLGLIHKRPHSLLLALLTYSWNTHSCNPATRMQSGGRDHGTDSALANRSSQPT